MLLVKLSTRTHFTSLRSAQGNMSVCVCVMSAFFWCVISRSSSVRFRHKAQTPESREFKYFYRLVAMSVWCHCALQHYEQKKHTHTHSPGVYTKEQWLYRKSIEHIKNRKRGANIVKLSFFQHLSRSLSLFLLPLSYCALFMFSVASLQPDLLAFFSSCFELISVLIVFNEL